MKVRKKLQKAQWAAFDNGMLKSKDGELPIKMKNSDGSALALILDDTLPEHFGADVIRFEKGKGVSLHIHKGSHILLVTKGKGILTYFDECHEMYEGMIYLIPPDVPHAIHAKTELVLIAIGNDHQAADSGERLDLVGESYDV